MEIRCTDCAGSPDHRHGRGTFASQYPAYRDPRENTTAGKYAHNDYIQLAAEGGIPALVLLLGILAGLLLQLKRSLTLQKNSHALEAAGLLLGVLALFIHANLNFIFCFALMNILVGLFAARAIQLINPAGYRLCEAGRSGSNRPCREGDDGRLHGAAIGGTAIPPSAGSIHLDGLATGLALLRTVWPTANAFTIAKSIAALRPSSGIAQEQMLRASEEALKNSDGIAMAGVNLQRELLEETLGRYELIRAQTANSPAYGVREARTLILYRDRLEPGIALRRAREILAQNLRTDPFHTDSMIALSRLEVLEGHPQQAQQLLAVSTRHVLGRQDQQLLAVEILRQRAVPRQIAELDTIEKQLRNLVQF